MSAQIAGTPTQPGSFTFTIQATDSASHTVTASFTITVAVVIPPVPLGSWRFLIAAQQPDGSYLDEIAQASQRSLFLRTDAGQNNQVTVEVFGDAPFAPDVQELVNDIHVLYGQDIIFCGRIGDTQDTIDATGHHVLANAYDYREVLRRRAILPGDTLSWASFEQQVICWQMITATQARTGGNLGISQGQGKNGTGVQRSFTATVGDYIGDDIDTISQMDQGFEWAITPYGQSDLRFDVFFPEQGVNRGVVLQSGDGRVASIVRTLDASAYGNVLYETGDSSASPVPTPQFLTGTDFTAGRWETVFGSNLITSDSLVADAKSRLAMNQAITPSYSVTCFPGTWGGPSDIFLGDTVELVINSGRLAVDDLLRVLEMQFDVDPNGVETLTMTLGAIPFRFLKKIPAMLKRLRYLETR